MIEQYQFEQERLGRWCRQYARRYGVCLESARQLMQPFLYRRTVASFREYRRTIRKQAALNFQLGSFCG